jgi:SAM-dependent methyltransferase
VETIGAFYPQGYDPYHSHDESKSTKATSKEFSIKPARPDATMLDFGCGSGAFLSKMRNLGWNVTGVDFSSHAVETTKSLGIEAYQGGFEHSAIAGRKFDVITMRQVLEHLHDPLGALKAARSLLNADGILSVSVPNLKSFAYRVFGEHWTGIDFPRHLTFFTPDTLCGLLQKAGFTTDGVRFIRHAGWLRNSSAEVARSGRPNILHKILSTRFGSSMASRYTSLTGQCDCIQVLAFPAN